MELIDRVRDYLAREYGITSDEELMAAIDAQKPLDIGIFVSQCGQGGLHGKQAS